MMKFYNNPNPQFQKWWGEHQMAINQMHGFGREVHEAVCEAGQNRHIEDDIYSYTQFMLNAVAFPIDDYRHKWRFRVTQQGSNWVDLFGDMPMEYAEYVEDFYNAIAPFAAGKYDIKIWHDQEAIYVDVALEPVNFFSLGIH